MRETLVLLLCCALLGTVFVQHPAATEAAAAKGGRVLSEWCEVCSEVVGALDALLDSEPSQEVVNSTLNLVCRLVFATNPTSLATCEKFVAEYRDVVLFNFEEEVDAGRVCSGLDMCITDPTAPRFPHSAFTTDPSRVAVSWFTYEPTNSSLATWSATPNGPSLGVVQGYSKSYLPAGGYMHHAVITGLKPRTEYYYRVGDKETGLSEAFSFMTAPAQSVPFTVAIYGDMGVHNSRDTVARVQSLVQSRAIDWIFHIGDISYADDYPANIYEYVWNEWFRVMQPITSRVPYMVCPGNHEASCDHQGCEWYSKNFTAYNFKFRMPGLEENGSNSNMWYSLDYSYAHFVSFSAETDYPNAPYSAQFGDQVKWFEADLRAAHARRSPERPWIIVVGHRPIYTSNAQTQGAPSGYAINLQKTFEELLHKYEVDLYITGHEHSYERVWPTLRNQVVQRNYSRPAATAYLITGAAGCTEGLTPWKEEFVPEWSAFRTNTVWGFSTLAVSADRLEWRYLNSADGSLVDSFVLTRGA